MKKTFAVMMAAMMLLCFAACSAPTATSGSDSSAAVIKIGATGPLTGGAAMYGLACAR